MRSLGELHFRGPQSLPAKDSRRFQTLSGKDEGVGNFGRLHKEVSMTGSGKSRDSM
jgi:hypothetical protein